MSNSPYRQRTTEELRDLATVFGLLIQYDGSHWVALKDGAVIAREKGERMLLACAIARATGGVSFDSAEEVKS
jgi:hypothetical protein